MKKVAFFTLGCKVNQYETEAMSELFASSGYEIADFESYADIYVINTCTVTAMSDRKSRQMIRKTKKYNPNSFVIVTGCYAQTNPEAIKKIENVNLIIGNNDRSKIVDLYENSDSNNVNDCVSNIMKIKEFEELKIDSYHERTRAFIKIQEGCNQYCSYCIIPYARGPIRSRDFDEVIKESKRLVENGYTEIIYTGIHVASYGLDKGKAMLSDLLVEANKIEGLKRIRLSSIEPMTLDQEFIDKIKDCDKLCNHFHLSLQSGCDETLKRMNRKYTTSQYKEIVDGLRKNFKDCAITTDIMTGFPGETDEEFEKTLEFANTIQFADAHIFQYSQRKGTVADKMDNQIDPKIKEERSKKLIELCKISGNEFVKKTIGKTVNVLFEQAVKGGYFEGKTSNYITVYIKSQSDLSGQYKDVLIEEVKGLIAYGKLV